MPTQIILAPIRGITDRVYREAVGRTFPGFDRAVAPFIKLRRDKRLLDSERQELSPANNLSMPVVPQVHTNHAPAFSAGMRELHELGHEEVNWNLGCPYPMVAKRQKGAGLLPYPDRIGQILTEVLADCPVRLSVKIRLGYHDPDEYVRVIEVLNQHPICEVTLHPRIATQFYDGEVDLERAEHASSICRHPFVYNGDIISLSRFKELAIRFPTVSSWMLGRGAMSNPFLPMQIKGEALPDPDEMRRLLRQFHDLMLEGYQSSCKRSAVLGRMREQWKYLANLSSETKKAIRKIRHSKTMEDYLEAVDWILEQPISYS